MTAPEDDPTSQPDSAAGLRAFGPATQRWFEATFPGPTEVQRRGWELIQRGDSCLLVAPTGSGKTLAAFLAGIDRLSGRGSEDERIAQPGVRVLYISPLKALVYDVERNLQAPLDGVRETAQAGDLPWTDVRVDVRTGDTPQKDRARQARAPGEILVTTPESLYLLLGSRASSTLRTVETVIVDEIHSLAPTKRGAHLALSLERLNALAGGDVQRIGLSATVRPLDEVARYLGGERSVEIVDASSRPELDLAIRVPVPDMQNVRVPLSQENEGDQERGLWPMLYPELVNEIRAHRSTILFVNSRGLCERLVQRLNELAGEELVLAHHGSVSHEKRTQIENGLKQGLVRAIVATSSLELGIDMGAVDRVILVESPGSVARGLQRIGRAGHQVGVASGGSMWPKFRGDLLESAVIALGMAEGAIEPVRVPKNALDVLAQQIVAIVCQEPQTPAQLFGLVRRAHSYRELARAGFDAVLDMLTGRFPGTELADLRPRLRWDRENDVLSARRGAELVVRFNAGTIPDRGTFGVYIGNGGPRIGDLDEEMVYEARTGDLFVLGASTWRIEEVTRDRVIVSPAPGQPGRMPFWHGDKPGRPLALGRALGRFVREFGEALDEAPERWLRERLPVDDHAATNLIAYVREQRDAAGRLPTDRTVVVERFRDELGDWRVCILSPFGAAVHAPWAMALEHSISTRTGVAVELLYTDDGIVLTFADGDEMPEVESLFPDPVEVADQITEQVGRTALFASLFRENAVRSLLVPRRRPQQRSPLWAQRLKTRALLASVQHHADFPIVLETYREALSDVFDVPGLRSLLEEVRAGSIEVHAAETDTPSPFARSLVFSFVANYLYNADAPLAERRAQALTLDRSLLADLVGHAELRELLDADAIAAVESELQGLADDRHARDRDELHDLLRRVGDLTRTAIAQRCAGDPSPWIDELHAEKRITRIAVGEEERWVAIEDAPLYRDAFATALLDALPSELAGSNEAPLEQLLLRFARCHGPFTTGEVAAHFHATAALLEPALASLETRELLRRGALRPGGTELEWCAPEVLRRIKRRTLDLLRAQAAAVDGPTLARFLPAWHGITTTSRSPGRLLEAIERLEGMPLSWRALSGEILPARVPDFTLDALDTLAAQGEIVWVGSGALGQRDGRVRLFTREAAAVQLEMADFSAKGAVAGALFEHLSSHGASFLTQIEKALREAVPGTSREEMESALWELVWDGQITNDTFQPLRALSGTRQGAARRGGRGTRGGRDLLAGGRWSLVSELCDLTVSPTERWHALATTLLGRYGVVARECLRDEELPPGGYGSLLPVLRAMEEVGRLRRGHFVEGWSGAQFAGPGAVDRLRQSPPVQPEVLILSAVDPANPWGSLLPWPAGGSTEHRPRRLAGARLVLVLGAPCLWISASGRHLLTFGQSPDNEAELGIAARALALSPRLPGGKRMVIERIDGASALESPHRALLLASGFGADYRALVPDPA